MMVPELIISPSFVFLSKTIKAPSVSRLRRVSTAEQTAEMAFCHRLISCSASSYPMPNRLIPPNLVGNLFERTPDFGLENDYNHKKAVIENRFQHIIHGFQVEQRRGEKARAKSKYP